MCGIAGFVDKRGKYSPEERRILLEKMLAAIRHRGPDGSGIFLEKWGGMVHARLSILDLSEAAGQPMWNEHKTLVLSFNGEIYNHNDFKKQLGAYTFRTHSDTESLLYGYEEWGRACLLRLKGMFSFSIFDKTREEIFLAVDRFGMKPLYYLDTPEWFAWGSEIKALLVLSNSHVELNTEVLGEHLAFRSIAGSQTLLRNVFKMLPAECLTYSLSSASFKKETYWQMNEQKFSFDEHEYEKVVRAKIEKSVQEHMLADVPIGIQLSGGLDSSLVSSLVKRNIPKGQELHSFSIGLADSEWNEFTYSRKVADYLQTSHHEIVFSEVDFCAALPIATYHYDEPINHPHSVPMMLLAKEAAKYVKILTSGEGADEIFGGYRRYTKLFASLNIADEPIIMSNAFVSEEDARVVSPNVNMDLSYRRGILSKAAGRESHYRLASYDLATYLTPLLLRQDKMGMSFGLENRVPFLDHELVIAGLHLPLEEKIFGGEGKILLKKIATEFLPNDIVYRKKVGFAQPLAEWFRNPKGLGAYLSLLRKPASPRAFLDYEGINHIINEHLLSTKNHAELLWVLITLELWMRIFIDGIAPNSIWPALSE